MKLNSNNENFSILAEKFYANYDLQKMLLHLSQRLMGKLHWKMA